MRARHDAEEILQAARHVALTDGLGRLTYGRVAAHLGIADRTVVYYFGSKEELITAVLGSLGRDLQTALADAVSEPATDHLALVRAAWPVLGAPDAAPVFALFFEATGLAAVGRAPFDRIVPVLIDGWLAWAADLVVGDPEARRTEAAAAVALLDGLFLLRTIAGPDAAGAAATALGLTD